MMAADNHTTHDHHGAHHDQHNRAEPAAPHAEHESATGAPDHGQPHAAHVDHTGHELVFRNRFWVCLALTRARVCSTATCLQMWLGFTMPRLPGSDWVGAGFAIIIFVIGGVPFLQMAMPELAQPPAGDDDC
jgi:Cu2+-exporting ATPase